jgi:hypothetical protein
MLYCTLLHYTMLYYTALHCSTVYYTTLHCTILHCTILYYTTLYYTTLHYTTLHYTMLCCTKLKLSHYTPRRRLGERKYSPYSFSTSTLDGNEWSASHPARALSPGNGLTYPMYRRLGGLQRQSGNRDRGKIRLHLPGIEPLLPGRPARSQTLY